MAQTKVLERDGLSRVCEWMKDTFDHDELIDLVTKNAAIEVALKAAGAKRETFSDVVAVLGHALIGVLHARATYLHSPNEVNE
jgi:hypothetical protein